MTTLTVISVWPQHVVLSCAPTSFATRIQSKVPSLQPCTPGSPTPGLHSRMWAVGKCTKLHLYLQRLPVAHITTWALPPLRSAGALDSHRSSNSTVNCACLDSGLQAPYESHPNTIPHFSPPPHVWKNCLPGNWSLVPKRFGPGLHFDAFCLSCLFFFLLTCFWSQGLWFLCLASVSGLRLAPGTQDQCLPWKRPWPRVTLFGLRISWLMWDLGVFMTHFTVQGLPLCWLLWSASFYKEWSFALWRNVFSRNLLVLSTVMNQPRPTLSWLWVGSSEF